MSAYFEQLCAAMKMLSEHPRSIFMGQAVAQPGTSMSGTFRDVPREKLLELPVLEDCQMGMATGMSLNGDLPICCYPRINFMLLAMSQLVLHLDALPRYSAYRPKVIIRTAVATDNPLDPGPQHVGDYSNAFRLMLKNVVVVNVESDKAIVPLYRAAMEREGSTLLIERLARYG
jgi:pyruvate/2-oxoglutarate/acetoin dehydrogenase E1 component